MACPSSVKAGEPSVSPWPSIESPRDQQIPARQTCRPAVYPDADVLQQYRPAAGCRCPLPDLLCPELRCVRYPALRPAGGLSRDVPYSGQPCENAHCCQRRRLMRISDFADVRPILKGWSGDRKYRVTRPDGSVRLRADGRRISAPNPHPAGPCRSGGLESPYGPENGPENRDVPWLP